MIDLENKIGYSFKDKNLLKMALTHSSFANENNEKSYERLEFLGDAVIELIVSDYIYKNVYLDSGLLSKLRASLVSTHYFCKISEDLGLGELMFKSKSLNTLSEKTKADLFESLVGAIYLDSGLKSAKEIILKYVIVGDKNIQNALKNCVDYKTKLQEEMQKLGKTFRYELVKEEGKDHEKTFEVNLYIDEQLVATGVGRSIHLAEEDSAMHYYKK